MTHSTKKPVESKETSSGMAGSWLATGISSSPSPFTSWEVNTAAEGREKGFW